MDPGGTSILEGMLCKVLTTTLFWSFLTQLPLKCLLSPKYPMCFEFLIRSYKFDPNVFDFFLIKKITSLLKKKQNKTKQNKSKNKKQKQKQKLSQISIRICDKIHFVWNFWKGPFFCLKSHFSPVDPFFDDFYLT